MQDKVTNAAVFRAQLMQRLAEEFPIGGQVELEGWRLRIVHVDPPTDYRDYALIELAPPKPMVPTVAVARLDQNGLRFRVPEGWLT
jgi:hypothetical protein